MANPHPPRRRWWSRLAGRLAVVRALFQFFWVQRLWWMIPLVGILLLVGMLLMTAQQSPVAPFVYTLF